MSGTEEPRSTRLGRRRPARLPHNERTNEHSGEDRPLGGCCRGGGQKKRGERAHSGGLRLPAVRQGVAHDGRRRAHLNDRVPVAERQPDAWKWPVPASLCGEVMFGTCECISGGQTGPGVGYPSSDSACARLEAKRPHKMGAKKAPACASRKKIGGRTKGGRRRNSRIEQNRSLEEPHLGQEDRVRGREGISSSR